MAVWTQAREWVRAAVVRCRVWDVLAVVITVGFFLVSIGYVAVCDHLMKVK